MDCSPFTMSHMAAELWLDSTAGWLAVVDGTSRYAMVERFHFEAARTYPGKASIIFWTNGPEVKLNATVSPPWVPEETAPLLSGSRDQFPSLPAAARRKLRS